MWLVKPKTSYRNSFVSTFFDDINNDYLAQGQSNCQSNVVEDEQQIIVQIALPGVRKADLKVSYVDHILSISSIEETKETQSPEHVTSSFFKLSNMKKQFYIKDIQTNKISAELEHGILTVTCPKKESIKPVQINIK